VTTCWGFAGGQGQFHTAGRHVEVVLKGRPNGARRQSDPDHPIVLSGKACRDYGCDAVSFTATAGLNIGGRFSKAQFQYTYSVKRFCRTGMNGRRTKSRQKLRTVPGVPRREDDQQDKGLEPNDGRSLTRLHAGHYPVSRWMTLVTRSFGQAPGFPPCIASEPVSLVMEVDNPKLRPGTDALTKYYVK